MKKLCLVVAVLMVAAAPALATVNITCTADGNVVTVNYAVVNDPNKVRAFALDIMVDSPAKINSIDYNDPNYWVFPGSIVIVDGEVNNVGSPVASPYDPCLPGQTLPGLDSNGVTIEMGSLYSSPRDGDQNAPNWSGRLLKFTVCHVFTGCKVRIKENTVRGGVVLTNVSQPTVNIPSPAYTFILIPLPPCPITVPAGPDPDGKYIVSWTASAGATSYQLESSAPGAGTTIYPLWVQVYSGTALSYNEVVGGGTWSYRAKATNANGSSDWCTGTNSITVTTNCLIGGNAGVNEFNDWVKWRYPACWCNKRQCRGDADGKKIGFWVALGDLTILRTAISKSIAQLALVPNGICADFDHKTVGFKVALSDLTILRAYISKADASVPICDQAPVITGPYNWWAN